jgi:hypothetical protein
MMTSLQSLPPHAYIPTIMAPTPSWASTHVIATMATVHPLAVLCRSATLRMARSSAWYFAHPPNSSMISLLTHVCYICGFSTVQTSALEPQRCNHVELKEALIMLALLDSARCVPSIWLIFTHHTIHTLPEPEGQVVPHLYLTRLRFSNSPPGFGLPSHLSVRNPPASDP